MAAEETKALQLVEKRVSLAEAMASRFSMEPNKFLSTVVATCFPNGQASHEQLAAFLAVAHEYSLNPFTRELFAFPSKGGGIVPIVSIDGWVKLVVTNPDYNGMEFFPVFPIKPDGTEDRAAKWIGCRCVIYRKSIQGRPAADVTEWYDECHRNTEPWNKMPRRMLRHKALKEAARYAFGFGGITDEDEGRDIINVTPESSVMETATATKAEALKEKITKKKAETAPAPPSSAPEPATSAPSPSEQEAQAPELETLRANLDEATGELREPEPEQATPITEAQRRGFLDVIQQRYPSKDGKMSDPVKLAIRDELKRHGYSKTSEVMSDKLPALMEWARTFKV